MKRLVILVSFLFMCSGVFAASVTPGSYSIDFEPNHSGEYSFDFGFDDGVEAEVYAQGDLAQYVTLDKDKLIGGGTVVAILNLPENLDDFPGVNKVRIGARQLSDDGAVIGVVSNVWGTLKVNVPYPGSYVEMDLKAPNANSGDTLNFSVEVFNRGEDKVSVSPVINIFSNGSLIESIDLDLLWIYPFSSEIVYVSFDTSGLSPGDYVSEAVGNYGDEMVATDENDFRLGSLFVDVVNYTRNFSEGKLGKFQIEIESYYNLDLEDVNAEVRVIGNEDAGFLTPTVSLRAWRTAVLEGALDTSNIDSETFQAEIIIYYLNETTVEVVDLNLSMKPDYTLFYVLGGSFVVLAFIIWRIVVFVRRTGRKSRKKKNQ